MENLSCTGEELILTLWTFTVTDVPARPLSFRAAASLSIPSSLSPVDHKQLSELRYFILTDYRTRGTWAVPFHFTRRYISNSESNYIYWRTRNFHQSKEKGSLIPDYSKELELKQNKDETLPKFNLKNCLSTWRALSPQKEYYWNLLCIVKHMYWLEIYREKTSRLLLLRDLWNLILSLFPPHKDKSHGQTVPSDKRKCSFCCSNNLMSKQQWLFSHIALVVSEAFLVRTCHVF